MMSAQSPSSLNLHWTAVRTLAEWADSALKGLSFDRAIVPERPEFPDGFLKGEWVLRFRSRAEEVSLLVSLRSQNAFFAVEKGKGPKASERATRSGFDLGLNKILDGLKVTEVSALPEDRVVLLRFAEGGNDRRYTLVLQLFPALPEAALIETGPSDDGEHHLLARTKGNLDTAESYRLPSRPSTPLVEKRPPPPFPAETPEEWARWVRALRISEALSLRKTRLSRELKSEAKNAEKRLARTDIAHREAGREPNYSHWGDLLKAAIGTQPPLTPRKTRKVHDWTTDSEVELPCDEKLSVKEQVQRFYDLAKRKERRLSESTARRSDLQERLDRLHDAQRALASLEKPTQSLEDLREKLERLEKIEADFGLRATPEAERERKALFGWEGKVFFSQEGLPILVGRSSDENLKLTFKFARGNDLWFHVRGKRGSHVVVPLRSKKNASLETLLDAAALCVYYSGGENWGKTEVDYTQKKHIKRIKDSTEVTYSQNKTLLVNADPERLKRLKAEK